MTISCLDVVGLFEVAWSSARGGFLRLRGTLDPLCLVTNLGRTTEGAALSDSESHPIFGLLRRGERGGEVQENNPTQDGGEEAPDGEEPLRIDRIGRHE